MTTRRLRAGAIAIVMAAGGVVATPAAQEFDVASVKPSLGSTIRGPIDPAVEANMARAVMATTQNGRFRTGSWSLHLLIQMAYDVKDFQVDGGPSWIRSDRYLIEAATSADATSTQLRAMLQSLLADRFKLALRRDTRTLPVYELVPVRSGLTISPMKEGDCITMTPDTPSAPVPMDPNKPVYFCGGTRRKVVSLPPDRTDRVEAGGIRMSDLVDLISEDVGRTVIDKTGFTSVFNLLLDFAPLRDGTPSSSGPTLFTALQEQLGLRLQSASGPVDVLVVDRVERPSEN